MGGGHENDNRRLFSSLCQGFGTRQFGEVFSRLFKDFQVCVIRGVRSIEVVL